MERVRDFVVVTQGICFLCRDKIKSSDQLSESILESIVKRNQSASQSIQYISRYLKMDMSKVFISEGAVPPHLLEKVKRSRLKVELCEDCSRLNDTFSKLFRKLEKAEIEVASCLGKIARKLSNDDGVHENHLQFHKLAKCESKEAALLEKLKMAEALRLDAVQKCNRKRKVGSAGHRVKVTKLSPEDIPPKKVTCSRLSHEQDSSFSDKYVGRPNAPDDESDHWDTPGNMEVDGTTADSFQSIPTTPRQNNTIPKSYFSKNSETGRVKCNLCLKDFVFYTGFHTHYKNAHLKIRLKCDICHADFSHKHHLTRHQRSVHFGQRLTFTCKFCSKTLPVGSRSSHRKSCNQMKQRQLKQRQRNARELPSTTEVTSSKTNSGVKQETSDDVDDDHTGLTTPKLEAVEWNSEIEQPNNLLQ